MFGHRVHPSPSPSSPFSGHTNFLSLAGPALPLLQSSARAKSLAHSLSLLLCTCSYTPWHPQASNIEATPTVTSEATTTETPEDDTAPVFDKDNCVSWLCQRHPQVTDNSAALWNWKEKGEHTLATRTRVDKCVALVVDALATEANERKKTSDYDYMGGTAALMTSVSDYFSSFSSSDECTENSVTTFVTETFTWLLQKGQDELAKE
eukprot:3591691-Rhodomonas_salina.1